MCDLQHELSPRFEVIFPVTAAGKLGLLRGFHRANRQGHFVCSNAKPCLLHTAAQLAPVPSAICPHKCSASDVIWLLASYRPFVQKCGGSRVKAPTRLGLNNEADLWSALTGMSKVEFEVVIEVAMRIKSLMLFKTFVISHLD